MDQGEGPKPHDGLEYFVCSGPSDSCASLPVPAAHRMHIEHRPSKVPWQQRIDEARSSEPPAR